MKTTTTEIEMVVKAWSTEREPHRHRVQIDHEGNVRVYDPIAGHFTTIHSMSAEDVQRARESAYCDSISKWEYPPNSSIDAQHLQLGTKC